MRRQKEKRKSIEKERIDRGEREMEREVILQVLIEEEVNSGNLKQQDLRDTEYKAQ